MKNTNECHQWQIECLTWNRMDVNFLIKSFFMSWNKNLTVSFNSLHSLSSVTAFIEDIVKNISKMFHVHHRKLTVKKRPLLIVFIVKSGQIFWENNVFIFYQSKCAQYVSISSLRAIFCKNQTILNNFFSDPLQILPFFDILINSWVQMRG